MGDVMGVYFLGNSDVVVVVELFNEFLFLVMKVWLCGEVGWGR